MVNSLLSASSKDLLRWTHIPTQTMARTMMIMKNTAAMATTTYSQMEVGSCVREVSTVGSVGEGILVVGLEEVGTLVGERGGGGEEEEEGRGREVEVVRRTGAEVEGKV